MSETTYSDAREAIEAALAECDEDIGITGAILAHLAKVQPAAPETKRQMYVLSDPAPQPAAPVEVSEALVERITRAHHESMRAADHTMQGKVWEWDFLAEHQRIRARSAMRAALTAALECQRGGHGPV